MSVHYYAYWDKASPTVGVILDEDRMQKSVAKFYELRVRLRQDVCFRMGAVYHYHQGRGVSRLLHAEIGGQVQLAAGGFRLLQGSGI